MFKKRKSTRGTRKSGSGMTYQVLEQRQLLAGISFNSATGTITIDGTAGNDSALVSQTNTQVAVWMSGFGTQTFASGGVNRVVVFGNDGNDWFRNNTALPVFAYGNNGDDTLIGGSGADFLKGGLGADRLKGNAGNDNLVGDEDDDVLIGDDQHDQLNGGPGNDNVLGGAGDDSLAGGDGDDSLQGEDGNDSIGGEAGHDWMHGGNGDDLLTGGTGNDRLVGHGGNDRAWGGDGVDLLLGDDGDDRLAGELGDDTVLGGAGVDNLFGNAGIDLLFGGDGDDFLFGNEQNDKLFGQLGNDTLRGGSGDDTLYGAEGNDDLFGDNDHDAIFGGAGDDRGRGGFGHDDVRGDSGNDDLDGESGDDNLTGAGGSDRMVGGLGNDDFFRDSTDDVLDSSEDYSSAGDFEIRGLISNLDTQARTLTMLGFTVNYGGARVEGSLVNGAFFKVEGSFANSIVTASEVEQKNPAERTDNFEARGIVSNLNSAAKTFQMLGLTIRYDNAEVNVALQNGANVRVEGLLSSGIVAAREVESGLAEDSNINRNFELRAVLENLNPAARTFTLLGITVNYANAQVIGTLANGARVKVAGNHDGTRLTAREVQIELPDDRDENVEATGQISNFDGSAQTFRLLGFTIHYDNAEVRVGLANGAVVTLEGWLENGIIAAEKIR